MKTVVTKETNFYVDYYCFCFCNKYYESLKLKSIIQKDEDFYSLSSNNNRHISIWDFIDDPTVISERTGIQKLSEYNNILVTKNMQLPIIEISSEEISNYCFQNDNDDLYFFDDSFSFTVVFTHEYVGMKNRRYCLLKKL